MEPRLTKGTEGSLRLFVHNLNRAWLSRRFGELAKYFHDETVILSPDTGKRVTGKRACVKSYEQFMSSSRVHDYRESGFTVNAWGSVAVITYRFRIKYEWNGKRTTDTGRDIFLVVQDRGKWKAVWRTLIADKT